MTDKEIFYLTISFLSFLKTSEKKILCKKFSRIEDVFKLSLKDLSFLIGRSLRAKEILGDKLKLKLEKAIKIIERYKIDLTCYFDPDYPENLKQILQPPFVIFSRGKKLTNAKKICIVGTRFPTGKAKQFAFDVAKSFAEKDFVVTSGMAMGIDSFAHKGAISVDKSTVAVLACSVENLYPRTNIGLASKIVNAGGSIISEYPPETPPLKFRFLERNRIISALSECTIVMEAPEGSGALYTAEYAQAQNKITFIFEQLLLSPKNNGAKKLNAKIVNSVDKIIDFLKNTKYKNDLLFSYEELNNE